MKYIILAKYKVEGCDDFVTANLVLGKGDKDELNKIAKEFIFNNPNIEASTWEYKDVDGE